MAGTPLKFEDLDALPLPVAATDRLVVGRGNDLKRLDFDYWRGGLSDRRIVQRPQSGDFNTWVNQDGATSPISTTASRSSTTTARPPTA